MTPDRTAYLKAIAAHDIGDWADRLIERSLTPPQSTRADVPVREASNGKA